MAMFCLAATGQTQEWPTAWYEQAQTASELGITAFTQSPFLADRDLPPVEDRLPPDPLVSVPLNGIGRYGGTARISEGDNMTFFNVEGLFTISADHKTILPNLAESWTYSEDGRTLTVKLKPGLRWSDGAPHTTDDYVFTTRDLQLNPNYQPVTPQLMRGMQIEQVDKLTMRYHFAEPSPVYINIMAQFPAVFCVPKHYLKQFHPDHTDPDLVRQRLEDMGYLSWSNFILTTMQGLTDESADVPTMRAFKRIKRTPTFVRYERNPYYFKVDPRGQQLPYIDAIHSEIIADNAVVVAKASTGDLDFVAYPMLTQNFPLLKLGERNGAIKVNVWSRLHGSDLIIQPNFNHPDTTLATLFWDRRFRQALSLAIDREEMNEIIYFSRGTPRQVTVIPSSDYFEPEFANAFAKYNPDEANKLLDAVGLHDKDGNGFREYPDGTPLTITAEYMDFETPKQISMELVASYWQAVGIDLRLKLVDRGLQWVRAMGGDMEMTVWHADRTTDILFPLTPDWWEPRTIAWSITMWNDWTRWNLTGGRLGSEPPEEVKALTEWARVMRTTMDRDTRISAGKALLRSNAENVWSIGTVGMAPHPVVVSKRLRGVTATGLWGWDTRWTLAYHPATWYIDE